MSIKAAWCADGLGVLDHDRTPAAMAEPVSLPKVPKPKGKLLAPKTATGPTDA